MSMLHRDFGTMIRIDRSDESSIEILDRIPLDTPTSQGNVLESTLQDLLFRNPQALPIKSIDASYGDVVPVCQELATPAGSVDALFVNKLGCLTLAEFKLWRNPQARREVIGQILDYAKELASWNYEDLQREVSKSRQESGNVLYELVSAKFPETDEAEFVDNVTRHLRRGEFLLLIVGDGIREGVERIVDFVQRHNGLHFNLALVEAALYRDPDDRIIVQPRTVARTEIVRRYVFEHGEAVETAPEDSEELSDSEQENFRFWNAVLKDYSFSDITIDIPKITMNTNIYIHLNIPGSGKWDLYFVGYLRRRTRSIGCYLMREKKVPHAVRIYEQIEASLDEYRDEAGDDLEVWTEAGRPRVGFRSSKDLPFGLAEDSNEFQKSVRWMQEKLDLLVSTIHPRLREMLGSKG